MEKWAIFMWQIQTDPLFFPYNFYDLFFRYHKFRKQKNYGQKFVYFQINNHLKAVCFENKKPNRSTKSSNAYELCVI